MKTGPHQAKALALTILVVGSLSLSACERSSTGSSVTVEPSTAAPPEPTTTSTSDSSVPTTTHDAQALEDLILVVGDWGSGTAPQGAVAGAMQRFAAEHPVTAVLTTGDNFDLDDTELLMQSYLWVEDAGIDWWITWGNHDVESEQRINAINNTFGDPPLWTVIEWANADVVILDSNQVTSLTQAAFFLNAMAASDRPMIIALHHPPYSCSHHGSTTEIVNQWVQVLDDDVILVLSGHDHSYQRFEERGVAFVVSGGGGSTLRPLSECPENHPEQIAGAELHHFLAIHQTETGLTVTAIDVNGDAIDQFSIEFP